MKKTSPMITLILALVGCALIMISVFSLYSSSSNADENNDATTAIEIANQKIDILKEEIKETKEQLIDVSSKSEENKLETISSNNNGNIPIIEIKDLDLSEDFDLAETKKKGLRIVYNHQIKFFITNVGKNSLKDVIFSIKDIYNDFKDVKSKKQPNQYNYMGRTFDSEDVGAYNNIEVNTLNLKTKKLVYTSNLPTSFGVADYYFDIIVEWNGGFYQMHVDIEELNGKLKYRYQFYDIDGKPMNSSKLENSNL